MSTAAHNQEAVMGQPIPAQHPSVVLRSHFQLVKALLAIAMAAVIGLTAAVVILANDDDQLDVSSKATPAAQAPQTAPGTRFDGGPEEGTRGAIATPQVPAVSPAPSSIASNAGSAYRDLRAQPPVSRYDGGPEEGTHAPISTPQVSPGVRYDGGPEEGTHAPVQQFKERAGGPRTIPQGPGSR